MKGIRSIADCPLVMDVAQAARVVGASETAVRDLIRRGELPSFRVGRFVKIARPALARFIGVDDPSDRIAEEREETSAGLRIAQ